MTHIRLAPTLPPLSRMLPAFAGFKGPHSKSAAILTTMRGVAVRLRTDESRRFYTTRTVAAFFGVSSSIVVAVFEELEREGVLVRIRGSGTLLAPRTPRPRTAVRGVVGVPIWQFGYCAWADWRRFFGCVEECLRRHQFVADFVFYRHDEPSEPRFAQRLLEHQLDHIVWFEPISTYRSNLQTLAEGGISISVLTCANYQFPFYSHRLSWRDATQRCLAAWKRAGAEAVTVVLHRDDPVSVRPWLPDMLGAAGLRPRLIFLTAETFRQDLAPLKQALSDPLMLPDHYATHDLGSLAPDLLAALLRHPQVLVHDRLDVPPGLLTGCTVNVACHDWERIAAQIASDLATGATRQTALVRQHEAHYHARVRAADYAQEF